MERINGRQHMAWEGRLILGQAVRARWTNCGTYYGGLAHISKINGKSVRAVLHAETYGYPAGTELVIPRWMGQGWSPNNGVFPVDPAEYQQ